MATACNAPMSQVSLFRVFLLWFQHAAHGVPNKQMLLPPACLPRASLPACLRACLQVNPAANDATSKLSLEDLQELLEKPAPAVEMGDNM